MPPSAPPLLSGAPCDAADLTMPASHPWLGRDAGRAHRTSLTLTGRIPFLDTPQREEGGRRRDPCVRSSTSSS